MSEDTKEVETTESPPPDPIPAKLLKTTVINGKHWLAGIGPRTARVMFVYPVVLEEEARTKQAIGYDRYRDIEPQVGNSPHWQIFKNTMIQHGLDPRKCFFVPIVRYLPDEKKHWTSPTKTMLNQCMPLLEADIRSIKPDVVVCVGKKVFDCLMPIKRKESEIVGGWFRHTGLNTRIYPMPNIYLTMKPEKSERFVMDFQAIKSMLDTIDGVKADDTKPEITVVKDVAGLLALVTRLRNENQTTLSVDAEWHGHHHVDGKLRSLQIAWDENHAAYIRFMDDQLNYVFPVPYKAVGKLLGTWLDRPEVKYIGHHLSADLVWMAHWLGLEWFNKGIFDTEFTLQCVDESLDLGLDILALRYTNYGKYDLDLITWKKKHPELCKDGYGYIPDDIMIPYAALDVLTVMRAYPVIKGLLEKQNLTTYYDTILNPLVTNVFTSFTLIGLPVDKKKMDEMREFYQWARKETEKEFLKGISEEAERLLKTKLFAELGEPGEKAYEEIYELVSAGKMDAARKKLREVVPVEKVTDLDPVLEHFIIAPSFKVTSTAHMRRWLFKVKKYTPVKSTNNKAAGMPSISWEKVLTYKPSEQEHFIPASDKGTLEILAARYDDAMLRALLEFKAIGNICKSFLKEADIELDENEEEQVVKEQGLHYWVTSDDRICGMSSITETGNRY